MTSLSQKYPSIDKFSREIGIPAEKLAKAFEIEKRFHERILHESDPDERRKLYEAVYAEVHEIYGKAAIGVGSRGEKDRIVRLFRRELAYRSLLDLGCGTGELLLSVARLLPHKELVGVDISTTVLPSSTAGVAFIKGDIIDPSLDREFDVVFSNECVEHIAPADLPVHLASVRRLVRRGGKFIVLAPNRLFGPMDVTRIRDSSHTNRVQAQGTHLNEPTYTELVPLLQSHGFGDFQTTLPIPKLKHVFSGMRIGPTVPMFIERHEALLNLLYRIKRRSRCLATLGVALICTAK